MRKPSEYLRSGQLYFAVESGEKSLPEVVRRLGDSTLFYASDIPHWDHDFPASLRELRGREDVSRETRQRILSENARRMYALNPRAQR